MKQIGKKGKYDEQLLFAVHCWIVASFMMITDSRENVVGIHQYAIRNGIYMQIQNSNTFFYFFPF